MPNQTFEIDGLRCGGCVAVVKGMVGALAGVRSVEVDHQTEAPSVVTIDAENAVDLDALQQSFNTLDKVGEFTIRR